VSNWYPLPNRRWSDGQLKRRKTMAGFLSDKGKESLETDALEDRRPKKVDKEGQRERAKRDLVTGKKPQGRNPGQGRDGDN
jgi:hypothetical protein